MQLYCYDVAYKTRGSNRAEHEARQALAHSEQEARRKVRQEAVSYRGTGPEEMTLLSPARER